MPSVPTHVIRAIQEMSTKYIPLLNRLERVGVMAVERRLALAAQVRRQSLERIHEEQFRVETIRRRLRAQIHASRLAERRALAAASSTPTVRNADGLSDEIPLLGVPPFDETLDWVTQLESESVVEPAKSAAAAKAVAAATGALYKPDAFVVAAPMYREGSGVRLACKKCDYTVSRGARGVHLFSWYDNYHLSLNEELFDTVLYKEVSDPAELKRSSWKRCKVGCPCCGSSLGSLGLANGRMKMMLKSVNLAWRKSGDNVVQLGKNRQMNHKWIPSVRPLGTSLMSSWLHNNAGLMTHNRRWVLDSTVLHTMLDKEGDSARKSAGSAPASGASSTPGERSSSNTSEIDASGECVVRSSEFENPAMTDAMKTLLIRSMAFESIVTLPFTPSLGSLLAMHSHFEHALNKRASTVDPALKEVPYDQNVTSALAFIRWAALNKVAQLGADPERASAVTALLKTPRFATMTKQCAQDISQNHQIAEFLPARTIASVMRVLYHHKHVFPSVTKLLAARKEAFGPYAGVFGRSSEYLLSAFKRGGLDDATITKYMNKVSSQHPTPAGRFGEELDNSGFTELVCSHGTGVECNRRATHGPATPPNASRAEIIRGRIPIYCRTHAPIGYVALAEGYRGVIPPAEEGARHHRHNRDGAGVGPWRHRRNSIVEVPDAGLTEFTPPEAGTLFLGEVFDKSIHVAYTPKDLEYTIAKLESHLTEAEKASEQDPQKRADPRFAIGLDVEWKPEFVFDANNNVCSIIQIATRNEAFIIDAIALGKDIDPLMRRLLRSPAVIKIGHGLAEDFARIAQGLSRSAGIPEKTKEYFPIEAIVEVSELFIKAENRVYTNGARPSLATMVDVAAGSRLDKRCQMTDWERRPLSPAQIRYAATDAACSFLIFDAFSEKLAVASGAPFDVSVYLQRDEGNTQPQRALPEKPAEVIGPLSSAITTTTIEAAGHEEPRPFYPASYSSGSTYSQQTRYRQPYAGGGYSSHHSHHASSGYGSYPPSSRIMSAHLSRAGSRILPLPVNGSRAGGSGQRKILSKWELRRLRELRHGLLSQGVRVDEHARLEGLQVASTHLQKSLSKVVRDSLVDPPMEHEHDDR